MRFYNSQHGFYCGVDLHAKTLLVCVVDSPGEKRVHKNLQCQDVDTLLAALQPSRSNLVVGCESAFNCEHLNHGSPSKPSFVGDLQTPRFYSVRVGHFRSTVGCLWEGGRQASSKRWFSVRPGIRMGK